MPALRTPRRVRLPGRSLLVALLFEVMLCSAGYLLYSGVRVAVLGQAAAAVVHGWRVLDVEVALHVAFELPLQSLTLRLPGLVQFFNFFYLYVYLPFIALTAVVLFLRDRERYRRARRTFLISGGIGLLIFARFPVAPPRLLPQAGFVDTIKLLYPASYFYPREGHVNQFAAIPSFHVGWVTLGACCLWQTTTRRLFRVLLAAVPPLMLLTVVITGNHLVTDALAGLAVVSVAYVLAVTWERRGRLGPGAKRLVRRRARWPRTTHDGEAKQPIG